MRALLFSIVLLTAFAHSVEAATYYVAKTGNNNNLGTQVAPWLTIQKAANTAVAGDTINIAAGTYAENVSINTSGTSSSRITWTGVGVVVVNQFVVKGSYHTFTNFTLTGPGGQYVGCIEIPGTSTSLVFSYITYTGTATLVDSADIVRMLGAATNCTFDHFTITQPNSHAATLFGSGHMISNWVLTGTNGWDVFRLQCSNTTIKNCDVSVSNPGDANPNHSDYVQAFNDAGNVVSQNNVIENCHFHGGEGYQLGNITDDQENGAISGWTFRNNIFVDIQMTLNLFAPDFTFDKNTFVRTGSTSGWAIIFGSTGAGHSNNLTIKNNIFYQCGYATNTYNGWFAGDPVTGFVHDYNLVFGTGAGTTKTGFTEANGINGKDPLFIDVAAGNYGLKAGSPAGGMGASTAPANAKTSITML